MKYIFISLITLLLCIASKSVFSQISTPAWVKKLGGTNTNSVPSGIGTDSQNNIIVTGIFRGTIDFDLSAGVFNMTSSSGSFDVYIAKYTTNGDFIWAKRMGGSGTEQPNGYPRIDANGNISLVGLFDSSIMDADPGNGTFSLQNKGGMDVFFLKLSANGDFQWAKAIGTSNTDGCFHLTVDNNGNYVFAFLYQYSVNIEGVTYSAGAGSSGGLAIKYNATGELQWVLPLGSSVVGVTADASNNIYLSGVYRGNTNFNPRGTAQNLNSGNNSNIFIAKYSATGHLIWVKNIQGTVVDNNITLALDSKDNAYLYGCIQSDLTFSTSISITRSGYQSVFLAKYDKQGNPLWAKNIGGQNSVITSNGLKVSKDNYLYFSGFFTGTIDFNGSSTASESIADKGNRSLFLSKYNEDGLYEWAFSLGTNTCANTLGRSVTIDENNDILLAGSFCSTVDFDASSCTAYNLTASSFERDSFFGKYVQNKANTDLQIKTFSIPEQISAPAIDHTNLKISVKVAPNTNLSSLRPAVTASTGLTISPASGTAQSFIVPLTYTISNGCSSLNYTVVVSAEAPVNLELCSGESNILTGKSITDNSVSFLWEQQTPSGWVNAPGNSSAKDYQTSSLLNPAASVVQVKLRRKVVLGNNTSYDSFFDLKINPKIDLGDNKITSSTAVYCQNEDPQKILGSTPSGGNGVYTYQWQQSSDAITFTPINGQHGTLKDYDPPALNSTMHFRRLAYSGSCATVSESNVVTVNVNNRPSEPIVQETIICPGESGTIVASSSPGSIFKWYTSESGGSPLHTGNSFDTGILNSDSKFYVEAENGNGCSSVTRTTASVKIRNQLPPPAPYISKTTLSSVSVSWNAVEGAQGYELSVDQGQKYVIVPATRGIVSYTATDLSTGSSISFLLKTVGTFQCEKSTPVSLTGIAQLEPEIPVWTSKSIFVPNAFTPNHDGNNDLLYVYGENIKSLKFKIFSQWGELLFYSANQSQGWDGTYKGIPESSGVYVYHLEAVSISDEKLTKKGTITLIR